MRTERLSISDMEKAVKILKKDGLVAIPTETVYGLAANALSSEAVDKIFRAKGRPSDNPLIVHISMLSELYSLAEEIPINARKLADAFWPGPLTVILPKSKNVPYNVTGGLDSVALRMPDNFIARKLIRECSFPLAAPSANISGKPSPTKVSHVLNDFDGKIDAIIDGGDCQIGIESTVINFCCKIPTLLRPGQITKDDIEKIIGPIKIDPCVYSKIENKENTPSPGVKYAHYSPNADLILVLGDSKKYADYVNSQSLNGMAALCFEEDLEFINIPKLSYGKKDDIKTQASLLFDAIRSLDSNNVKTIFAHCASPDDNLAVYNRLLRAAGFNVIEL